MTDLTVLQRANRAAIMREAWHYIEAELDTQQKRILTSAFNKLTIEVINPLDAMKCLCELKALDDIRRVLKKTELI
jgi:hypothetical protein